VPRGRRVSDAPSNDERHQLVQHASCEQQPMPGAVFPPHGEDPVGVAVVLHGALAISRFTFPFTNADLQKSKGHRSGCNQQTSLQLVGPTSRCGAGPNTASFTYGNTEKERGRKRKRAKRSIPAGMVRLGGALSTEPAP